MSTNYPGGLDSFVNPSGVDPQNSPSHSWQHTNTNDAMEAVQAELGTDPAGGYATVKARLDAGSTPIGTLFLWSTDSAPTGFLLCYGQAVSRATYSDLHTLLKDVGGADNYAYGNGDGSTTFNVPDLRGRTPLGKDNMGGASADRVTNAAADSLAGNAGAEDHTLITSETPAHTHQANVYSGGGSGTTAFAPGRNESTNHTTSSVGSDGAHNNMSPYITLSYIIKT